MQTLLRIVILDDNGRSQNFKPALITNQMFLIGFIASKFYFYLAKSRRRDLVFCLDISSAQRHLIL